MSSRIENGGNPVSLFNLSSTTLEKLVTTDSDLRHRVVQCVEDYDRAKESQKVKSLECVDFVERLRQLEESLTGKGKV